MNFLRVCRKADKMISFKKKWFKTLFVLILGLLLGTLASWSKTVVDDGSLFKHLISIIDLSGFTSRISFWMIIIALIAVNANSPLRAILNTALFMLGVLGGYYGYTFIVLSEQVAVEMNKLIIPFSVISILSMIIWYAKGEGWFSVFVSALLIAFFFRESFDYGIWYFKMSHIQELIIWIMSILILHNNISKTTITLFYSLPASVMYELFLPYIGL